MWKWYALQGAALVLSGIWLPFFIAAKLPDGWAAAWYGPPTIITLLIAAMAAVLVGGDRICFAIAKYLMAQQ